MPREKEEGGGGRILLRTRSAPLVDQPCCTRRLLLSCRPEGRSPRSHSTATSERTASVCFYLRRRRRLVPSGPCATDVAFTRGRRRRPPSSSAVHQLRPRPRLTYDRGARHTFIATAAALGIDTLPRRVNNFLSRSRGRFTTYGAFHAFHGTRLTGHLSIWSRSVNSHGSDVDFNDRKRPGGLTLILRQGGKPLLHDVTVVFTFADFCGKI